MKPPFLNSGDLICRQTATHSPVVVVLGGVVEVSRVCTLAVVLLLEVGVLEMRREVRTLRWCSALAGVELVDLTWLMFRAAVLAVLLSDDLLVKRPVQRAQINERAPGCTQLLHGGIRILSSRSVLLELDRRLIVVASRALGLPPFDTEGEAVGAGSSGMLRWQSGLGLEVVLRWQRLWLLAWRGAEHGNHVDDLLVLDFLLALFVFVLAGICEIRLISLALPTISMV